MTCNWPALSIRHLFIWLAGCAILFGCGCDAAASEEPSQTTPSIPGPTPLSITSLDLALQSDAETPLQLSHSIVERHFWRNLQSTPADDAISVELEITHGIYYRSRQRGGELIVDLKARSVGDDAPLLLRASAREYRPLALGRRDDNALQSLALLMLPQAMESLVQQIQLRAQVASADRSTLGDWITNDEREMRLAAIREAVSRGTPPPLDQALDEAVDDEDRKVALRAARALHASDSPLAVHAMMRLAQRLSRDGHIDDMMTLLPPLSRLDEPWVHLYLETVEEAHPQRRVRQRVRQLRLDAPSTEPVPTSRHQ